MGCDSKEPRSNSYVYFIVFVGESFTLSYLYSCDYFLLTVNLLTLCGGLSIGWTSPVLPKLTNPNRTDENPLGHVISENEESWITAVLMLGPIPGSYPWGILSDQIGRKWTLTLVGIPLIVSYIILATAKSVVWFLIARFLIGFTFGGAIGVLFVYIGEIADVRNRGKLLSFYTNFLTFGLLLAYILGAYLSVVAFSLIAAAIPTLFLCLFVVFGVESPVYLLKKDRRNEAFEILKKLRVGPENDVETELVDWEIEVITSRRGNLKDLLSNRVLIKGLALTTTLMLFQQLSGINVVLAYAQGIFETAGSSLPTELSAILIGSIQFLASFTTPLLVDRLGRKILFVVSTVGLSITQTALGAYFYVSDSTSINVENFSWLPVLVLVLFIVSYNSAFNVLPFTVAGEIFPSNVRSTAVATAALVDSATAFVVSLLFMTMRAWIGSAGSFWLFAGFCVLALVFVVVFLPETKGKTLEQIHKKLRGE